MISQSLSAARQAVKLLPHKKKKTAQSRDHVQTSRLFGTYNPGLLKFFSFETSKCYEIQQYQKISALSIRSSKSCAPSQKSGREVLLVDLPSPMLRLSYEISLKAF